MARTLKDWGPTQLTTSAATYIAGDTTLQTVILELILANTTTGPITVQIAKATSTTVSAATALFYDVTIPPKCTLIIRGPIILEAAGTPVNLNLLASANSSITLSASGYAE